MKAKLKFPWRTKRDGSGEISILAEGIECAKKVKTEKIVGHPHDAQRSVLIDCGG